MDTDHTVEQQIQTEIERIRCQFPQTQDLYREACVLLFFRFGITPTANKLYQFVRKGSMSAPADALTKFWEDLREKSRVRIEHPDLPADLRTAAGELTSTLWGKARVMAQESLSIYHREAQAAVLEAKSVQASVEAERDVARQKANEAQVSLHQASDQVRALEQQLAAEGATRKALLGQIQQASQEIQRLHKVQEETRQKFSAELDKVQAGAQLAEERFRASEERALLEIDRERTLAGKLQKELDLARAAAGQAVERHRSETAALQMELGDLRQQTGHLEGNLQAVTEVNCSLKSECDLLRIEITNQSSLLSAVEAGAKHWERQAKEVEAKLSAAAKRKNRISEKERQQPLTRK
jgi:chromosome segregation ATPase